MVSVTKVLSFCIAASSVHGFAPVVRPVTRAPTELEAFSFLKKESPSASAPEKKALKTPPGKKLGAKAVKKAVVKKAGTKKAPAKKAVKAPVKAVKKDPFSIFKKAPVKEASVKAVKKSTFKKTPAKAVKKAPVKKGPRLAERVFGMDLWAPVAKSNEYGARSKKNLRIGTITKKSYVPSGLSQAQYQSIRQKEQKKRRDNYSRNVKKAGVFEDYTEFYTKRGTNLDGAWMKDVTRGHRMAKTKYDWSTSDDNKPFI